MPSDMTRLALGNNLPVANPSPPPDATFKKWDEAALDCLGEELGSHLRYFR